MPSQYDLYGSLGVNREMDQQSILSAIEQLVQTTPKEQEARRSELFTAWAIFSDESKRAEMDAALDNGEDVPVARLQSIAGPAAAAAQANFTAREAAASASHLAAQGKQAAGQVFQQGRERAGALTQQAGQALQSNESLQTAKKDLSGKAKGKVIGVAVAAFAVVTLIGGGLTYLSNSNGELKEARNTAEELLGQKTIQDARDFISDNSRSVGSSQFINATDDADFVDALESDSFTATFSDGQTHLGKGLFFTQSNLYISSSNFTDNCRGNDYLFPVLDSEDTGRGFIYTCFDDDGELDNVDVLNAVSLSSVY